MNEEINTPPRQYEFSINVNVPLGLADHSNKNEQQNAAITTEISDLPFDSKPVNLFNFEFYTNEPLDAEVKQEWVNSISGVMEPLIDRLDSHLVLIAGVVERICIVEPDILGEVIFQIQKEKGLQPVYTGQDGYFTTAAKTISYKGKNGDVQSIIVFQSRFFINIINPLYEEKPYEEWNVEGQQLCYYILAHEYGHALDSYARNSISTDEKVLQDEEDWEELSEHYAPLLFNEYLACRISSNAVTPELQKYMLENWQRNVAKLTNTLNSKYLAYSLEAAEVINCFWIILVELGRLLGHQKDDINFPEIVFWKMNPKIMKSTN